MSDLALKLATIALEKKASLMEKQAAPMTDNTRLLLGTLLGGAVGGGAGALMGVGRKERIRNALLGLVGGAGLGAGGGLLANRFAQHLPKGYYPRTPELQAKLDADEKLHGKEKAYQTAVALKDLTPEKREELEAAMKDRMTEGQNRNSLVSSLSSPAGLGAGAAGAAAQMTYARSPVVRSIAGAPFNETVNRFTGKGIGNIGFEASTQLKGINTAANAVKGIRPPPGVGPLTYYDAKGNILRGDVDQMTQEMLRKEPGSQMADIIRGSNGVQRIDSSNSIRRGLLEAKLINPPHAREFKVRGYNVGEHKFWEPGAVKVELPAKPGALTVGGMAKGKGIIAPVLAGVGTDALYSLLRTWGGHAGDAAIAESQAGEAGLFRNAQNQIALDIANRNTP